MTHYLTRICGLAYCLAAAVAASAVDTRELDVNLVIFEPGLETNPAQYRSLGIFPQIRELEARYLPFALRDLMVQTQQWGPVRVLPEADPESELLITGSIIHSDGVNLQLALKAVDSTGREWLNHTYSETARDADFQSRSLHQEQPFRELYAQINRDLQARARLLSARQLEHIQQVALLRYARSLAPQAFSGYLSQQEGGYVLQRLPADDDPMLARVLRLREQEYLFIDTVDGQYARLFVELGPSYDLWRQLNREQVLYQRLYEDRLSARKPPRKGSYQSMKRSYLNFKWAKVQEQESARLAEGLANETQPTFLELEGRVVELNGSLQDQYREWRELLREIFQLEASVLSD